MKLHYLVAFALTICVIPGHSQDPLLFQLGALKIYKSRALFDSAVLYDAADDLKKFIEEEGDCAKGMKAVYNPLSLTGPYYSYEKQFYDEGGQGECYRTPSSRGTIIAVDVRTQKPVSILRLVDESSLVAAIKKDGWVKKLPLHPDTLSRCDTFRELLGVINRFTPDGSSHGFNENQFAVLKYDDKAGEAAVRLIRTENAGFNHSTYLQLGFVVKVLRVNAEFFKARGNFYAGRFSNGLTTR